MRGLIITFFTVLFSITIANSQVTEEYKVKSVEINDASNNTGVSFSRQNYIIFTLPKSKDKPNDNDFYVSLADEEGTVFGSQLLDGGYNSYINEVSLVFTNDFKKVYFSRSFIGSDKKEHFDLYVANVDVDNRITNIKPLPINYKKYSNAYPSLSFDNKTLYFASDRLESLGGFDIFKVDIFENGKRFGKVINLGSNVNTKNDEITPFVLKNRLFFSSNGRNGFGKLDVFSVNINLKEEAKNLGKTLNTPENDFGYIRKIHRNYGFLSSNRAGGKGSNDIYYFKVKIIEPPVVETIVEVSKEVKVNEDVEVSKDIKVNEEVVVNEKANSDNDTLNSQNTGIVKDIAVVGKQENLKADKAVVSQEVVKVKEPEFVEEIIYEEKTQVADNVYDFQRRTAYNTTKVEVGRILKKRKDFTKADIKCVNKIEKLKDIYFDLNKFNIRADARIQVNKAIKIMNKCPNLKFVASSYTDSRGSSEYNRELSQRRATSVVNYILENSNLSEDRIVGVGYGESNLKNKCYNGVKCSNKQHQVNRRTEIEVVVID